MEKGAELRERPERERERDRGDRDRGDRDGRSAGERRWNEPYAGGGGSSSASYGQGRERDEKDRQGGGGWKRSSDRTEREFGRDRERGERGPDRDSNSNRDRDRDRGGGERAERREFGGRGERDRERAGGETEAAERFAAAFGRKADGGSDRRLDRERLDGGGRGFDRSSRRDDREYKDRDKERERDRDDREHKDRGADWGPRAQNDSSSRFPPRGGDRRVLDDGGERRADGDSRDVDDHRDGFGFPRQTSGSSAAYSSSAASDSSSQLDESELARLEARYGAAANGPMAYSRDTILALFQPSSPPPSLHAVPPELGLVSPVCLPPVVLSAAASDTDGGPFWLSSKGSWHAKRQQAGTLGRRQYSGASPSHSHSHPTSGGDRSTPAWFDQPVASILEDEQQLAMTSERVERERTERRMERERGANSSQSGGRNGPERQHSEPNELTGWTDEEHFQSRKPSAPSIRDRASLADSEAADFESPPPALPALPASPPSLPLSSAASSSVSVSQWYYKDPQEETQGPFSASEMKDWYTKGYFDLKLKVMCTHSADVQQQQQLLDDSLFIPLGVWFIAGKKAFLDQVPTLTHDQPSNSVLAPTHHTAHVRPPQPRPQAQHAQHAAQHTLQRSHPALSALRMDEGDSGPRLSESGGVQGLYTSLQHDDEDDMVRLAGASLRFVDDDSDRQVGSTQHSHMHPLYALQQQQQQQHLLAQQPHAAALTDGSWSTAHVTPYPSARMASPIHASAAPGMGWPATGYSPHHSLAASSPRSAPNIAQMPPSPLHSNSGGGSSLLHEQMRQAAAAAHLGRPQQPLSFALPTSPHVAAQRADASYSFHSQQSAQQRVAATEQQQQHIATQRQQQAIALARERLLQQQQQQQLQMGDGGSVWISSPQQLREREEMLRRQQQQQQQHEQQQQQLADREEAERRRYDEHRAVEELQREREREAEVRAAQQDEEEGDRERERQQQQQQQRGFQSASAQSSLGAFRAASAVSVSSQSAPRWPTASMAPSSSSSAGSVAGRVLTLSEVQALDAEEAAARDREDARSQREYDEEQRRATAAASASGGSVWKAGGQKKAAGSRSLADIMAEEAQQSQTHMVQQQQQQQQQQSEQLSSGGANAWQQHMKTAQQNAAAVWGVLQLPASISPVPHSSPAAAAPAAARSQPPSSAASTLSREKRVAAEQHSKAAVETDRRRRQEAAQRAKAEDESRRKAEAVERGKVQAAKVWGTQAPTIDLRAIQQQEAEASRLAEERREQRLREQQLAAAQSTMLGSVWGGVNPLTQNVPPPVAPSAGKAAVRPVGGSAASPSHATSPPSLKDIQAMEAQTAHSSPSPVRTAGGIVPSSSGGVWSVPNSSASSGKKSGTQPATTIRLIDEPDDIWGYNANTATAVAAAAGSGGQKQRSAAVAGKASSSSSASIAASASVSASSASAFGVDVVMSADFSSWCRSQLNQITGSSDLTLAHYLLSLDSPQQVEETCITYLGATEPVKRFAQLFIANADFDRHGQPHRIQHSNSSNAALDKDSSTARREADDADKKKRGKKRGGGASSAGR